MATQQLQKRSSGNWASQIASRFKNRPPLPSYAEAISHEPGHTITAAEPRACRELLREIYALHVYISNLGDVFDVDKPIVLKKRQQAAGAMKDLRRTVKDWMENEAEWTEAELAIITQIYDRIRALQSVPLVVDNEIRGNRTVGES